MTAPASGDKVLDLLVAGREYFATHEWNRDGTYFAGTPFRPDVSTCCAVGAVLAAAGADSESGFVRATEIHPSDISDALYEALTPEQRYVPGNFYYFNDFIAESKDEILAVFDRAIEARKSAVQS